MREARKLTITVLIEQDSKVQLRGTDSCPCKKKIDKQIKTHKTDAA